MMIDFYILESEDARTHLYACQLLEKCYEDNQTAYVALDDVTAARKLDVLLWTFREDSFVPHNLAEEADAPIVIGTPNQTKLHDVLMNLSQHMIANYRDFKRVIEIVSNAATAREAARERYRHYRDAGFQISTHKLKV